MAVSKYPRFATDRLNDYPIRSRSSKVEVADFGKPMEEVAFSDFLDSIPSILGGADIRALARRIRSARDRDRAIIWGFGGHVVKVGLSALLIDLMDRGLVTALATNGAGLIHDFEIAFCGRTSEDVDRTLDGGEFGMARETGEILNRAIREGAQEGLGLGEAAAKVLLELELDHPELSLFLSAYRRDIPISVHVALGTDIIHNHPAASGEALGRTSMVDFQVFTHAVSRLDGGGVYLNCGSAVLLPEVFLKAVSVVRNAGRCLTDFSTANLDFIQHYRPLQNVIRRPVTGQGKGYPLTGHHELLIPLLAALLKAGDSGKKIE